jgi:hypothetical protein
MSEKNLITAYEMVKVVNAMLKARGLKEIPTQMGYNYIKNGLVKSVNGRVRIEDAEVWAEKYVAKRVEKAEKAKA